MLTLIAESGGSLDSSLIGAVLQSAGTGTAILVVLFLLGLVVPKSYAARVEKEADQWRAAFEAKDRELTEIRSTLAVQTDRADNAILAAQRSAEVLERLQRRSDPDVAEGPAPIRRPRSGREGY